MAYLRKKIDQVNGQINKQDNLINKIKNNQQRLIEKKRNILNNSCQFDDINQSNREIFLKRKEDHKRALQNHRDQILKTKKQLVEIEKALLDEYSKTMSKREEKDRKIKEINENFKSGELFLFEKQGSNDL